MISSEKVRKIETVEEIRRMKHKLYKIYVNMEYTLAQVKGITEGEADKKALVLTTRDYVVL